MYKEMHAKEVERIGFVTSRLQWSISVWIILFGGLLYAYNSFEKFHGFELSFYISISAATFCSLTSIILIFIGLYNTKTLNLPRPSTIQKHYKALNTYYEELDSEEYNVNENSLENGFAKYLEDTYIKTADYILIKNDKRIYYSHLANIFMMVCGIFLLTTFALMIPNILKW